MNTILTWSLESTLVLSVLFLVYFICFRNNTSVLLRRRLMLFIVVVSLVSPLLKYDTSSRWAENRIVDIDERIITSVMPAQEIASTENIQYSADTVTQSTTPTDYWSLVYICGAFLFAGLLVYQLTKLAYIFLSGNRSRKGRIIVVNHPQIKTPSSFLFAVFLPLDHELSERELEIVIQHERHHITQKHSLDLLLIYIIQILSWYNPLLFWMKRELKNIHEVLADKATLEKVDNQEYFHVLLASAFSVNSFSLSHCFGQKNSLLRRIQLIKKQQTTMKRTSISLFAFSILIIGVLTINTLKGQQIEITSQLLDQAKVTSDLTELQQSTLESGLLRGLTGKHQTVFSKLEEENSDRRLSYRYFKDKSFNNLLINRTYYTNPIFISELTKDQKVELIEIMKNDTTRFSVDYLNENNERVIKYSTNEQIYPNLRNTIIADYNYLVIYEYGKTNSSPNEIIYNSEDVDVNPEILGGLKNFERSVALEFKLPDELAESRMPETIDFSFVVRGGSSISNLKLLTELKGNDRINKDYYLFFGQVHDMIRKKISQFHPWKRGIKNGEEVLVRMKVSIPTKYMYQ